MCGIVGYIGKENSTIPVLLDGLKKLEYRGYDSAGIAYYQNHTIEIKKAVGKIKQLEQQIDHQTKTPIGIGHTRWATHGKPTKINSHPHHAGAITIVHNGIIENYKELKQFLKEAGYTFYSDTDTEVMAALLNYFYEDKKDIKKAIIESQKVITGSYALCIMVKGIEDTIYAIRKDSPLVIGHNENESFIASDPLALLDKTNQIHYLEEGIIAQVKKEHVTLYNRDLIEVPLEWKREEKNNTVTSKGKFEHYMLKEIYEQPQVLENTTTPYLEQGIDSLLQKLPNFTKYQQIHIVACGSAYHAGCVGKKLIEELANIPVSVEIASEYRYNKIFYDRETLVIVVSQSGETADTLAALKKAKTNGCDTLAIVNVQNSTIAREAHCVLVTQAGREIAVATTKAYSAQIAMLDLIALGMAKQKNLMKNEEIIQLLKELENLPTLLENYLKTCPYQAIAQQLYQQEDIFFIGRGLDYALCLEGSLKLKEISYIHSEAYAAGELKHGTISLIESGTPVIAIVTEKETADKTFSNVEEVASRGANVTLITTEHTLHQYPNTIILPKVSPIFQPLFTIIPLQLISYEVARLRECDIDKPKNLAKSVTVE